MNRIYLEVKNPYVDAADKGSSRDHDFVDIHEDRLDYAIHSDGSVTVLSPKDHSVLEVAQAIEGLDKIHVDDVWGFSQKYNSTKDIMPAGTKAASFCGSPIIMKPDKFDQKYSVLFLGLEELTATSLQLTFRLFAVEMTGMAARRDWVCRKHFQYSSSFYAGNYPRLTEEESITGICSARPVVTLTEQVQIILDFSEETGRYFMVTLDRGREEKQYKEVLPFVRLFPQKYYAYDDIGLLSLVERFHNGNGRKLSSSVATLRKYPMLAVLYRTYGKQANGLLNSFGIWSHSDGNVLAAFTKFNSPAKVFGVTNNFVKLAIRADSYSSDYSFFQYFYELWKEKNPQVVESIVAEYMNCYEKMLKHDDYDEAYKYSSRPNSFLWAADTIVGIIRKYGGPSGKDYDFRRLFDYITEDVYVYQGISLASEAATLLRDYYNCLDQMGVKIDDWFPRSLKLAHDMAVKNHSVVISEQRQKRFAEVVKDPAYQALTYADKDWVVLAPSESKDLITEGRRQSHCVGSYVDYVANKQKFILFMRRADDLETPVITLDVDPEHNTLNQYRGFGNRAPNDEEMAFIRKWAKKKKLKIV